MVVMREDPAYREEPLHHSPPPTSSTLTPSPLRFNLSRQFSHAGVATSARTHWNG